MKKFKDLQAGDTVYIGFEKKVITKIVPDKEYSDDGIVIYISKDEFYYVKHKKTGLCTKQNLLKNMSSRLNSTMRILNT